MSHVVDGQLTFPANADRICVMLGPVEEENALLRVCLGETRAMLECQQAQNESLQRQLLDRPRMQVVVPDVPDLEHMCVEREALLCELEDTLKFQASQFQCKEESLVKELNSNVEHLGQLQIILRARERAAAQCNSEVEAERSRAQEEQLQKEQWKNEANAQHEVARTWKMEAEHWKDTLHEETARWEAQTLAQNQRVCAEQGKEIDRLTEEVERWKQACEQGPNSLEVNEAEIQRLAEEAHRWKHACSEKGAEAGWLKEELRKWKETCDINDSRCAAEIARLKNELDTEIIRVKKDTETEITRLKKESDACKQVCDGKDELEAEVARLKQEVHKLKQVCDEKYECEVEVSRLKQEVHKWKQVCDEKYECEVEVSWLKQEVHKWKQVCDEKDSQLEAEVARLKQEVHKRKLDCDEKYEWEAEVARFKQEVHKWKQVCDKKDKWEVEVNLLKQEVYKWKQACNEKDAQWEAEVSLLKEQTERMCKQRDEAMETPRSEGERSDERQNPEMESLRLALKKYSHKLKSTEALLHTQMEMRQQKECGETEKWKDAATHWQEEYAQAIGHQETLASENCEWKHEMARLQDQLLDGYKESRKQLEQCARESEAQAKLADEEKLVLLDERNSLISKYDTLWEEYSAMQIQSAASRPSDGISKTSGDPGVSNQYEIARIDLRRASLESKQLQSELGSLKVKLRKVEEELYTQRTREVSLLDELCDLRERARMADARATETEAEYANVRQSAALEGEMMTRGLQDAHAESLRLLRQSEEFRGEAARYRVQLERLEAADRSSVELQQQALAAERMGARLRELERDTEEATYRMQQELRASWAKEKDDGKIAWADQLSAVQEMHTQDLDALRVRLADAHAAELLIAETACREKYETQIQSLRSDLEAMGAKYRSELDGARRADASEHHAELEMRTDAVERAYRAELSNLSLHTETIESTYRAELEQCAMAGEQGADHVARLRSQLDAEKAKCELYESKCLQSELATAQAQSQLNQAARKEKLQVQELGKELAQLRGDLRNDLNLRASMEASTRWSRELEDKVFEMNAQQKRKAEEWKRTRVELEGKLQLKSTPNDAEEERQTERHPVEDENAEKLHLLREELDAESRKRKAHERLRAQMEHTHADALRQSVEKERRLGEEAVNMVEQKMTGQLEAERRKHERLRASIVAERRQLRQFFQHEKVQVSLDKERVEHEVRMSRSELTQATFASTVLEDEKENALQQLESWQQDVLDLTTQYVAANASVAGTPSKQLAGQSPCIDADDSTMMLRNLALEVTLNTVRRLRSTNLLRTGFYAWRDVRYLETSGRTFLDVSDAEINISTVSALDLPGWPKSPPKARYRYDTRNNRSIAVLPPKVDHGKH